MGNEIYQVGVARADITPPIGIRLCGYTVREGFSHAVDAPLSATVLVVSGGGTTVALIAVDLTLASIAWTQTFREHCVKALGIPSGHILINFNHTHAAPIVGRFWPQDSAQQLELQTNYEASLFESVAGACRDASASLTPARIGTNWGECAANINRRQKTPEGDMLMGEDPDGFSDHSVGVLRFDHLDGSPLAVAFRFSCHPVTLGPRTNVISPDFPVVARDIIENALGCPSLFLQGCAGNQNPITGIGHDTTGHEDTLRIGQMVGGEVLKVCAGIRTHRMRSRPTLIRSVAVYWMYGYDIVEPGREGHVSVTEEWMELNLKPILDLAEAERERADWAKRLADVRASESSEADLNVAVRFDYWSSLHLAAAQNGMVPVRFPVQIFRMGDVAIVGLPFEVMAETGAAIRTESPVPQTFVLGYSNGIVTYLPTEKVSREGGMEARLGYKNYLNPSELPGDWEVSVREKAIAMLGKAEVSL